MRNFKQLPLNGELNDYSSTRDLLKGLFELDNAIRKFYTSNSEYNPRQLHYIVTTESYREHLDRLINWKDWMKNLNIPVYRAF